MSRLIVYLLTGLLVVLVQTAFLAFFPLRPLKPEFLLILTVYLALHESLIKGGLLVYLFGSLYDVFAGPFWGLHGFTFLLVYYFTRGIASRMNTESSASLIVLVGSGTILHVAALFFSLAYFADISGGVWLIFWQLFPQTLLNLLATGLLIMFLSTLQRRFPRLDIPGVQRLDDV
ncbi:MAG: rod shape-determining protein MreD [Desulfuromonadaceae bacterium]|nr:rod shape-determining protein MreD [Desulfuromonadaceae bacterium]